jgi:hypothetical protein
LCFGLFVLIIIKDILSLPDLMVITRLLCDTRLRVILHLQKIFSKKVFFFVSGDRTENKELAFHFDDSHVTLNVCLGRAFSGSGLFFCGMLEAPDTHNELITYSHLSGG